jgi:hypothetical protein
MVLIVGAALRSAAASREAWTPLNIAHHRISRISAFLQSFIYFPTKLSKNSSFPLRRYSFPDLFLTRMKVQANSHQQLPASWV